MQEEKLSKGPWHEEEDELLVTFVTLFGERRWDYIAKASGLKRSGKSCGLRWLNYLCPNIKHGYISTEEEQIIIQLHKKWGNKWSRIARNLPGRTDNEIKNYWRTRIRKKIQAQEQENFQFGRNNAKRDSLFSNLDFNVQKHETDDEHKPGENPFGTDNSFDVLGFPNSAFASSPYKIRIRDWMSELSDDQSKITQQGGSNIVESCFGCQASIAEYTDTWGWSGSIWDMN
ncbi:hypothetical protein CISIN_1g044161mg [Citrus sinensis]|uniref:Uncharacterized protein n=1 Tax=Citrus sinensis TaxID=2711 RepID=A0A067E5L0_CITSI|nr:hypothetical protein CISIN_1g044161mg [Citrus sinensis]